MNRFLMSIIALLAGAIMMQSFQCASRELTTAKVALKSGDFPKAIEYAQKDIEKNPKSQEAYLRLAQAYNRSGAFKEAIETYRKAEEVITDPKLLAELQNDEYTFWTGAYNSGIQFYQDYNNTRKKEPLDKALLAFQAASMMRPEMPDIYNLRAQLLIEKGDSAAAIVEYRKAAQVYKAAGEVGSRIGIYMDMDRQQMITKLGAPKNVFGQSNPQGDSLIADQFVIDGKTLYVFSSRGVKENNFAIRGWRYDPNPKWMVGEQSSFASFDVRPMAELATYEYGRKQYDEALTYLRQISTLQPANPDVNSFMVSIYNESGRTEEALSQVKTLIEKDPKNKYYLAQYADILMAKKDYDQAITYYERALAVEPNFDFAVRNVASAYKNKAVIIQQAQKDKSDADKTYTGNTAEYFPILSKSAEYFNRAREFDQFKDDYNVLAELFNIYLVLDRKDDMRKVATELEAMESTIPADQMEYYNMTMVKVYSALKETEKLNKLQEKLK